MGAEGSKSKTGTGKIIVDGVVPLAQSGPPKFRVAGTKFHPFSIHRLPDGRLPFERPVCYR